VNPAGEARRAASVAGVLLAAGESSRMGSPKQLLPVGSKTLLRLVLEQVLESDLGKVVLVLGHRSEDIKKDLESFAGHPKLLLIENSRYKEGISSSIIAGLSQVEEEYDHVMLLLGDMPHIHSRLINPFLTLYLKSGFPLGAVTLGGRRSHPVIFSRKLYGDLRTLKGDKGGRDLFGPHSHETCLFKADRLYDDMDIDTQEDYLKYRRSLLSPPEGEEDRTLS
jgi:molybdenum cofactor cytidylyltransferase